MLYHTLQRLPPPGSLQEWVLILYLDRIESIEHAKFRALSQILLTTGADDQSPGVDAFEDYMKKAFPTLETKKNKKHGALMNILKDWVGKGALSVTPLPSLTPKGRSKMVSRVTNIDGGAISSVTAKVGGLRAR